MGDTKICESRLRALLHAGELASAELDSLNRLVEDARRELDIARKNLEVFERDSKRMNPDNRWWSDGPPVDFGAAKRQVEKRLADARERYESFQAARDERLESLIAATNIASECRKYAQRQGIMPVLRSTTTV